MSKFVKDMMARDLSNRLQGVEDCLVVNVIGMNSGSTAGLRKHLREKNIRMMVVKNSVARRACEGSSLAPAFEGVAGSSAVVWGAQDFVSLAKEIVNLDKDAAEFDKFQARGGVLDGEQLTPERIKEISKWPTREEQLSLLVGQLLGPGAQLVAQLQGPGGSLASQIKQIADKE